jgi:dihydroorotate dehydrogenase electron transfer subunit
LPDREAISPTNSMRDHGNQSLAVGPTVWRAAGNTRICDDHYRLTLTGPACPPGAPGQFVTIAPAHLKESTAVGRTGTPFYLRRAMSIAGLRRTPSQVEIDVIYRVIGAATRWMRTLRKGDDVSLVGPLGSPFPVSATKPRAWLVAGGVGVPPLLWMAQSLAARGKSAVALLGAREQRLLPVTVVQPVHRPARAVDPSLCVAEFAAHGVPSVLATDDGSAGFAGDVVEAVRAHDAAHPSDPAELVVYACGPDAMLASLADWCIARGLECHVCLERAMACGLGTCQSCVVPVRCETDPDGWTYELCCSEGPVFDCSRVAWKNVGKSRGMAHSGPADGQPA